VNAAARPSGESVKRLTVDKEDVMTATRMVRVAAMATLAIGLALPCGAGAQASSEVKAQVCEVSTAIVAERLGSKASPLQAADLVVGTSFTCVLVDPAKLAALGATELHAGARVTFARIASDKLRVEVDEIELVPLTKKLTLKIDPQGRLSAASS
jgi:hypothetical protein